MKRALVITLLSFIIIPGSICQSVTLEDLKFLLGEWNGVGKGFGNETSTIESSFKLSIGDKYIEVQNESWFIPTEEKPEGDHHLDKGYISYDKNRKLIVFRQFNIEGYVNQYILIDSLSDRSNLVFETEIIENFTPDGRARWTIKKISHDEIETIFDVAFNEQDGYTCMGINRMKRKQ